jgi:hypothetical protein
MLRTTATCAQRACTVYKTVDCLIATLCLQAMHELPHRGSGF